MNQIGRSIIRCYVSHVRRACYLTEGQRRARRTCMHTCRRTRSRKTRVTTLELLTPSSIVTNSVDAR